MIGDGRDGFGFVGDGALEDWLEGLCFGVFRLPDVVFRLI